MDIKVGDTVYMHGVVANVLTPKAILRLISNNLTISANADIIVSCGGYGCYVKVSRDCSEQGWMDVPVLFCGRRHYAGRTEELGLDCS